MEVTLSDGTYLHVRIHGEGERSTILLHGWSVSGRVWDGLIERWPADAGRLVVPDLRGSGWSAKPRSGYTLERYARDVVELIAALKLAPVTLVGHSMGGAIAQLVAVEQPDLVSRLLLVCPVPASGVPLPTEALSFFRAGAGHREGSEKVLRSAMAIQLSDEAMDKLLCDVATVSIDAYLEGLDAWRNAAFSERLGAIRCETVVLGGEAEPYLPPAFLQQAVVSKIAGARFVGVPGAGHYPQLETPDAFAAALVSIVRG